MHSSILLGSTATWRRSPCWKLSFLALVYLDLFLSVLAVQAGYTELNPFMHYLLASPLLLISFKLVIPAAISWLAPGPLLMPSVAFLSLVTAWNVSQLFSAL